LASPPNASLLFFSGGNPGTGTFSLLCSPRRYRGAVTNEKIILATASHTTTIGERPVWERVKKSASADGE
jgi:hypothetical protein